MDLSFIIALIAVTGLSVVITYFLTNKKANSKLEEYKTIDDAINSASKNKTALESEVKAQEENLETTKKKVLDLESEVKAQEENLETTKKKMLDLENQLQALDNETKELQSLKENSDQISSDLIKNKEDLDNNKIKISEIKKEIKSKNEDLYNILSKIDIYGRIDEFVDNGHYETPQYLFETSERFAEEIKRIREFQKDLIKNKNAITYPETVVVSENKSHNKKILDGQVRLMLNAFNMECDSLIGKVKPSTFSRTLERIEKLANNLEKSAATLRCGFNLEYIKSKYEECKIQYQYTLKKQEEQEEQRLIREQIREEQKAIKEYERAVAKAEKEERMYREMLAKAKEELSKVSDDERIVAEQRIKDLEQQLAEAEVKEERAKSMAEQTRKGHVYVISNIGSFGENVYKIGLTRRLEPMDRVKELGDASVPFSFDVHAMIYVDDAPALESALHREFTKVRVNAVNLRKEFFCTDLQSIKAAVEKISGSEADFKMTAAAEDYYETRRLQSVDIKAA